MEITEHFKREEFDCHDGTPYPDIWINDRLVVLCKQLEYIREIMGNKPIQILSGYRTEEYNKKIGGAKNSYHMKGMAADVTIGDIPSKIIFSTVLFLANRRSIEIGGLGLYDNFVHIDIRDRDENGEVITWRDIRKE